MKRAMLWGIMLIALIASVAVLAEEAPPSVVIKACAKKKPPVTFPHQIHAKKAKIECKTCHHKGDTKTKCSDAKCHAGPGEGKRLGCSEASLKKNVFHVGCISCHKKKAAGPTQCAKCHKKA
jgi:hypothetical protein